MRPNPNQHLLRVASSPPTDSALAEALANCTVAPSMSRADKLNNMADAFHTLYYSKAQLARQNDTPMTPRTP